MHLELEVDRDPVNVEEGDRGSRVCKGPEAEGARSTKKSPGWLD